MSDQYFQWPLQSPRKMAGMLPPARSGGAMMSGQPSPFMSATAPELRHEPAVGSPSEDSSKRTVTPLCFGQVSKNSGRIFLKYATLLSGYGEVTFGVSAAA